MRLKRSKRGDDVHKQLKAAIAVEVIVFVIAFAFTLTYINLGWYRSSHVLDVMLIVLWVLVAAALLLVFLSRSFVREEMVRRFYLSHSWIYNHEIGYAPLAQIVPDGDAYEFVTFAGEALARMSYGFEVATAPEDFQPEYLISSRKFQFHLIGDHDSPEDAGVVIDRWTGSLQRVKLEADGSHTYSEVGSYDNAKELAILLDSCDAVTQLDADGQPDVEDDLLGLAHLFDDASSVGGAETPEEAQLA